MLALSGGRTCIDRELFDGGSVDVRGRVMRLVPRARSPRSDHIGLSAEPRSPDAATPTPTIGGKNVALALALGGTTARVDENNTEAPDDDAPASGEALGSVLAVIGTRVVGDARSGRKDSGCPSRRTAPPEPDVAGTRIGAAGRIVDAPYERVGPLNVDDTTSGVLSTARSPAASLIASWL